MFRRRPRNLEKSRVLGFFTSKSSPNRAIASRLQVGNISGNIEQPASLVPQMPPNRHRDQERQDHGQAAEAGGRGLVPPASPERLEVLADEVPISKGKEKGLAFGVYPTCPQDGPRTPRRSTPTAGGRYRPQRTPQGPTRRPAKTHRQTASKLSPGVVQMLPTWSPDHADKILRRLERDVFPWIGSKPIAYRRPPEVLTVARRIEARAPRNGPPYLTELRAGIPLCRGHRPGRTRSHWRPSGRPAPDPRNAPAGAHRPGRSGGLLRAIDAFRGTLTVKSALLLSPWCSLYALASCGRREWSEIDLEKREWNIPAKRMKGWTRKGVTTPHLVPLAPQALAILQDLHPLTGQGRHVFAGRDPKKCMSDAAVNAALRRMGYDTKTEMTRHWLPGDGPDDLGMKS